MAPPSFPEGRCRLVAVDGELDGDQVRRALRSYGRPLQKRGLSVTPALKNSLPANAFG